MPGTPPPLPPIDSLRPKENGDTHATGFDPHQFEPSLHASLVSEILSLKRKLDSKDGFIDDLESRLSTTRAENDSLQANFKRSTKECRALKRELQLHEDGTLSAIEALTKERDEVAGANNELKKKLDALQKRCKSQEEETRRVRSILEEGKMAWINEKRNLERKVSLAETRLQTAFEDMANREAQVEATNVAQVANTELDNDLHLTRYADAESNYSKDSADEKRPTSRDNFEGLGGVKPSLADELDFSEGDDHPDSGSESEVLDHEARLEAAAREKRFSNTDDIKARKVLGIVSAFEGLADDKRDSAGSDELQWSSTRKQSPSKRGSRHLSRDSTSGRPESFNHEPSYVENGNSTLDSLSIHNNVQAAQGPDIEANQRRKRDPIKQRKKRHVRAQSDPSPSLSDVAEDVAEQLNEPVRPHNCPTEAVGKDSATQTVEWKVMVTASTQTDPIPERKTELVVDKHPQTPPQVSRHAAADSSEVPVITIHPPSSAPASPRNTVLPPRTKTIGCQTNFQAKPTPMASVAVQTEAIRIDKRPVKLPSHLLPSSLNSGQTSPSGSSPSSPTWNTPSINERLSQASAAQTTDAMSHQERSGPRPLPPLEEVNDPAQGDDEAEGAHLSRLQRLREGRNRTLNQDEPSVGLPYCIDETELSDGDQPPPRAFGKQVHHVPKQRGFFGPPEPLLEDEKFVAPSSRFHGGSIKSASTRSSIDKGKKAAKPGSAPEASQQYQSRLALLSRNTSTISSRSPSIGSIASSSNFSKSSGPRPPISIPTRQSSKEAVSRNKRNGGRSSPPQSGRASPKRRWGKQPTLRKARSAAAVADVGRPSVSSNKARHTPFAFERVPEYLELQTDMPKQNHFNPGHQRGEKSSSSQLQGLNALYPTGSASVGSSVQHSVVDAITATMIGEWMWKYMRKRSSFGVPESGGEIGKTGDARHKRWVWLSPYERCIMWSSKQPTTNTALMGRAGRKRELPCLWNFSSCSQSYHAVTIQSVLDVKDDASPPKAAKGQIFDRSILVLTPARALKFTATNRDRHYLWLTALSFLAHQSSSKAPNLSFLPPAPSVHESESSGRRSRAGSFLKGNKSKMSASQQSSGQVTPTVQPADPNAFRQGATAKVPESAFAPAVPRVPHRRKRSNTGPSRTKPSVSVNPTAVQSSNNSLFSAGNTSARVQSRASSSRSFRPIEQESMPSIDIQHRLAPKSTMSPRDSSVSAEFGGNSNFFDAVGMVRMDAFMKPGVSAPASGAVSPRNRELAQWQGHTRQESSGDSFHGPPDIIRQRPLRQPPPVPGAAEKTKTTDHFCGF